MLGTFLRRRLDLPGMGWISCRLLHLDVHHDNIT